MTLERDALALIERLADGSSDEEARDALLDRLAAHQASAIVPYQRLVARAGARDGYPGLPTDVFRFARIAVHDKKEDIRVFRTSGTTSGARGQHPFRSLALYEASAIAAAKYAFFCGVERIRIVSLIPSEEQAPDSSLSFMVARLEERFGDRVHRVLNGVLDGGVLNVAALEDALVSGIESDEPVALLGTSFAFVHAEDALGSATFRLPPGSRIMQTGGFKGRSREVDKDTLIGTLSARYGVEPASIVSEYSMTELSSQMYETSLRRAVLGQSVGPRRLWAPGWVRARVLDPESLREVSDGTVGVLRIDDCANVDSVAAIITADLARREDGEIELVGRLDGAVQRGCSLAVEEALG